jgi:undecaprenyl-diphosphatase
MSYIEAIILGIVQGVTEFLPISSTAHIVIVQHLFGLTFPGLSFEILLHQASVLAVIFFFRKDLIELVVGFFRYFVSRKPEDRVHLFFGLYIVVATVITGVLGYTLQRGLGENLKSPAMVALALTLTGIFLILIERFRKIGDVDVSGMRLRHAIIVGLAQTAAVLPGISRSGATLVAALWCGLNRETAVRYSFLLAIPVIVGSSVLALRDVEAGLFEAVGIGPLVVCLVVTFIFSVIGIIWLIDFLKKSRLLYFAIYCFLLAAFVFFYFDPGTLMDLD